MASALVLTVVMLLDLLALALAVAAELKRNTATAKVDDEFNYVYCVYGSDISTGFGAGAFLFLMASQGLIMVATKCFFCGKGLWPEGIRPWPVILFITCWVTFLAAEALLLVGSLRNADHTKYRSIFGADLLDCQTLRKGVFGAGAVFIFLTGILTELYYVCYCKANDCTLEFDEGNMGTYEKIDSVPTCEKTDSTPTP